MVATKWLARAAIIAGLFVLATAPAQAVTLNVVSGGLEATNASNYGCPTAAGTCSLAQRDYALSADALATGTITVNALGTIIDIALYVPSATFTGTGGPVTFGPVTYLATLSAGVVTTPIGPGVGGISSGFGTGSVSGTVNGNPFAVSPNVSISCSYPGGTGQCGISFGESGFTNVVGRDWRHQFDVTVVAALPEPTTALLVALGLVGLALRSRKA
jgi:hypothetical protein